MKILSILSYDSSTLKAPPGADQMDKMGEFVTELRSKGVLIDTGGRMPGQFEMIISRKNGKTSITDGPFTEAKEIVGGYALMEFTDRDEAVRVTNQFLDLVGDATCHLHEVESN